MYYYLHTATQGFIEVLLVVLNKIIAAVGEPDNIHLIFDRREKMVI